MQEELKARKYVMRIDRESKRREKIMHELVDKIEKSGLLKKNMRDEINQMILVNFLRKENEEKGTERYKSLKLIFKKEQERYEELEELRVQLREKEKEEKIMKKKIEGIKIVQFSDKSKLDEERRQEKELFNGYDKLKSEKTIIQQKVNEIEKELEEIERIYGRKIDEDEVTNDDNNMGDGKKSGGEMIENNTKEVEGTRGITVKDMEKKDEVRIEILKLLKKSDRLDGRQKIEIKESISDGYVSKFMDMHRFLEEDGGKNVLLDRNKIGGKFVYKVKTRDGKWEIYRGERKICDGCDDMGILGECGGKPLFKVEKNGRWEIYRGERKICNGCDEIGIIREYGGKPLFKVRRKCGYESNPDKVITNGKWSICCGDEEICYGCHEIEEIETEEGGVIFKVNRIGRKWGIYCGGEKICDDCDEIKEVENVGKEIIFKVKKRGELRVYGMGRRICDDCDEVKFKVKKRGELRVYGMGIRMCYDCDEVKGYGNVGGAIFEIKKGGKRSMYWKGKKVCEGYDNIEVIKDDGLMPVFKEKKYGRLGIYCGIEKLCEGCDNIEVIKDDGGDLTFEVEKGGKSSIYGLKGKIGGEYDKIEVAKYIGGKIFFVGKYEDKYEDKYEYDVYRGNEFIGRFEGVENIKVIDGRPAFIAKGRDDILYRGNEVKYKSRILDDFVKIGEDFAVKNEKREEDERRVCRKDRNSRKFYYISRLINGGTKPIYVAKEHELSDDNETFWGDERVEDARIESENIGGKPLISVKRLYGQREIYRGEKYVGNGYIRDVKEKGGEPVLLLGLSGRLDTTDHSVYIGEKEICSRLDFKHAKDIFNKLVSGEEEKNGANEGEKQDVEKKHGECEEKTVIKNDKIEEKEKEEKNEERNGNTNSQIEKRENFILEWYIKKRNRDDLFNILDLCIIDRKKRKEIKDIVFKDFEKNYEEASSDEEIKTIGENYKKLRGIERQIEREKEGHIVDLIRIYENLYEFAKMEMEVDKGARMKKIKLMRKRNEGKKLEIRQKEILEVLEKMKEQKLKLEEKMGKRREVKISKEIEGAERFREYKSNSRGEGISPKEYIELYEERIRYKEENMKDLIEEIGKMDIGVGEDVKGEVKERIRKAMSEEIEDMKKGGDERLKIAKNMKKCLDENKQKYEDYIFRLKIEIAEKEKKLVEKQKELEEKQKELRKLNEGNNENILNDIKSICDEIRKINEEIIELEKQIKNVENEFNENKRMYENRKNGGGTSIS